MSQIHVASRGLLLLSGVLSNLLDLLKLNLTMLRGLLKLRVNFVLELLRRALADVSLLFGDLLDLGDVLAKLVASFLSSLATLLLSLVDVLLDLLAKEKIRLIDALLAMHCGLAAFFLDTGRDGTAPVHEDIPALLFSALELVGDVSLTNLRGRGLRVGLESFLDLWD